MVKVFALAALVAGCGGATLGDNDGDVDAAVRNDSARLDTSMVSIDAPAAACPSGRKLYLHFDAIALTKAATSDSTQNLVSWMGNATVNLPGYHAASGTRAADIQTITDGIKSRLAGLPIEVVTTRPATGSYVMIVFGGSNTTTPGSTTQVETKYTYGTNEHDCGDLVKNDVGWVADLPALELAPDVAIAAIGWGLGLQGTSDVSGCMCGWATGACTLSASIASTPSTGNTTCPNQDPQNEIAAFSTGYCQ
jgi:hypothetical protein